MAADSHSLMIHLKNMAGEIQTLSLDVAVPTLDGICEALYHHDPVTYPRYLSLFRIAEEDGDEKETIVDDDILCMVLPDSEKVTLLSERHMDYDRNSNSDNSDSECDPDFGMIMYEYGVSLYMPSRSSPIEFVCEIIRIERPSLRHKRVSVRYRVDTKEDIWAYSLWLLLGYKLSKEEWVSFRARADDIVWDLETQHGFGDDRYQQNPSNNIHEDEPVQCECGSIIKNKGMDAHLKTKKHQTFLKSVGKE